MGEWKYKYNSAILNLVTVEVSGQLYTSAVIPEESAPPPPDIRWMCSWLRPRSGMYTVKKRKTLHCPQSNQGRPALDGRYSDWATSTLKIKQIDYLICTSKLFLKEHRINQHKANQVLTKTRPDQYFFI
jgi:hypothetical protein